MCFCLCPHSPGFKRKELRGKLAIGITCNFINRHTAAEAQVAEISGVARIYNQKFFQDLLAETGRILFYSTPRVWGYECQHFYWWLLWCQRLGIRIKNNIQAGWAW